MCFGVNFAIYKIPAFGQYESHVPKQTDYFCPGVWEWLDEALF